MFLRSRISVDNRQRGWMLSRFIDPHIRADILFCSIVKIHILVKQTIIHEGKYPSAVIAIVRALIVYAACKSDIKTEKSGEARYERGTFSRIGPVQTSLRPKANRSIHEKHDPRTKSERDAGGESAFGAGSLWKLPDLA